MWCKQPVIQKMNKDFIIFAKKCKGENRPLTFRQGFKCQYWVEYDQLKKISWKKQKIVQSNFNQRQMQNLQNFKSLV